MRGLRIYVYRSNTIGDCTNGGISSKYDELILVDENYDICPVFVDKHNPPENAVRAVVGFNGYKYLEPLKSVEKGKLGYMMGGNYAGCSDSRFHKLNNGCPLPIHDRTETQELYDMLSR